jgi:lipopolysaccharide transport system ATP-binding protein
MAAAGPAFAIDVRDVRKRFLVNRARPQGVKAALIERLRGVRHETATSEVLRGVTLRVRRGESHGIVGPNGSGKSTLLKLLARILVPDGGTVDVRGRVCALLELGAGFHPELTGRENIYLYGSILGFTREEIRAREPDIRAFARIGSAIESPVRTYSSGMYLRLGFAVAIHAEPEILLIDEILAVGDASFQARCKERIQDLRQRGVTIVFVSHDMNAVCEVCDRATLLLDGQVRAEGSSARVAEAYDQYLTGPTTELPEMTPSEAETPVEAVPMGQDWELLRPLAENLVRLHHVDLVPPCRFGDGSARIESVHFLNAEGESVVGVARGEALTVVLEYRLEQPRAVTVGLGFHHEGGVHLSGPNTALDRFDTRRLPTSGTLVYRLPAVPFHSGAYLLSVAIYDEEVRRPLDHCHKQFPFTIYPDQSGEPAGVVVTAGSWSVRERP